MTTQTAPIDRNKLIAAKEEELYFLQQIYKNLKYLHHMYTTPKLKNVHRAWHTQVSINNANNEVDRAMQELEELKTQL